MRDTGSRGIRRSFLVDFRQCRLKEAIALELGNELLVRNGGLLPALCYDGQIFEVFQQLFVLSDWNNDSRTFAPIVGNVLNRIAHDWRLAETAMIGNGEQTEVYRAGHPDQATAAIGPQSSPFLVSEETAPADALNPCRTNDSSLVYWTTWQQRFLRRENFQSTSRGCTIPILARSLIEQRTHRSQRLKRGLALLPSYFS
jgi:hypothetical protein